MSHQVRHQKQQEVVNQLASNPSFTGLSKSRLLGMAKQLLQGKK